MVRKIAFYGAKSLALGMYEAVRFLYPEAACIGFIVTSLKGNPEHLAGQKVWELDTLKSALSAKEREDLHILIVTPEDMHKEIAAYLKGNGFTNCVCMDSKKEAGLMERYYTEKGDFLSLHTLMPVKKDIDLHVYQAKFYKDKQLNHEYNLPEWIIPIQAGAALTTERICEHCDNQGENISAKNVNYCELTALYWMWKNELLPCGDNSRYYGLFHYRRILDVSGEDVRRMKAEDVDAVLPFPTLHEPDISEHHARYIKEADWEAMLQALEELQPEYAESFKHILKQQYLYNYNIIIAKGEVLADYCAWLFPVLARTEELSTPKGWERSDRYIGYLGENLMTLYFLYHRKDLKIYHTGRLMLT